MSHVDMSCCWRTQQYLGSELVLWFRAVQTASEVDAAAAQEHSSLFLMPKGSVLQGQELVAFERFMSFRKSGGNHCHVNVVPCPASAASTARAVSAQACFPHAVLCAAGRAQAVVQT